MNLDKNQIKNNVFKKSLETTDISLLIEYPVILVSGLSGIMSGFLLKT